MHAVPGSSATRTLTELRRVMKPPPVGPTVATEGRVTVTLMTSAGRLMVVDPGERDDLVRDDLVRDVTEVLTWLCARLYGRGSAPDRAARAVAVATAAADPS